MTSRRRLKCASLLTDSIELSCLGCFLTHERCTRCHSNTSDGRCWHLQGCAKMNWFPACFILWTQNFNGGSNTEQQWNGIFSFITRTFVIKTVNRKFKANMGGGARDCVSKAWHARLRLWLARCRWSRSWNVTSVAPMYKANELPWLVSLKLR